MEKFALLIGLQGDGKTYFAENTLSQRGYFIVNGDVFMAQEAREVPFEKLKKRLKK